MILPAVIMLVGITIFPLSYAFGISLYEYNILKPYTKDIFVGAQNYIDTVFDPRFLHALWITAIFVVGTVSVELLFGFGIALILHQRLKGWQLFRSFYLAPMVMAPVMVGILWRWMFSAAYGVVNHLIRDVMKLTPPPWVSEPSWALFTLILVDAWQWTPFVMLILLAGLESIPVEPLEAAKIDGASRLQSYRHVLIPLMKDIILIALILRAIDLFKVFDLAFSLTRGGPGSATEVASYYIYTVGFVRYLMGYAGSMSFILIEIISWVVFVFIRLMPKR